MMSVVVRCARCNIPLSDPRSIRRGFGPVCWAKIHGIEDDEMSEAFERVSELMQFVCHICGQPLISEENKFIRWIRFRVILANHLLEKHPDIWQGSLDTTLDVRRKEHLQKMHNLTLEKWREDVETWPPNKVAAFYQLMEPVYAETINMEQTSDVVKLNAMIWEVQHKVASGGAIEEYYRPFFEGSKKI